MSTIGKAPVAIVIGQGSYNDMGLIRSCGEANMNVVLISPKEIVVPINKSKYIIDWLPLDSLSETDVIAAINSCFSKFSNRIFAIYPAADSTALILDKHYEELSSKCCVPHAYGQLYKLMDKATMVNLAVKAGLDVPRSNSYDIDNETRPSFQSKCIIKPLRSVAGGKEAIQICKSEAEFNHAVENCIRHGVTKILIQDLIEGTNQEEIAISGVSLPDGKVLTHGMIHKKRIRGNGSTVFADYSTFCPAELQAQIREFMKQTRYQGIFDIEFLHNDTGYHFIECNFRNGAYGYAVTSAGFNMPSIFYNGIINRPIDTTKLRNIRFMEERTDMLNVFDHSMSLFAWLKDFFSCNTLLWWNRKDMGPFRHHILKKLHLAK